MKDFVKKLQKDLTDMRKELEVQSEHLVKSVQKYARKDELLKKGIELEEIVEKQLKKFEPTFEKVLTRVRDNAKKAGFDVDSIETKVRKNFTTAKAKLRAAAKPANATRGKAKSKSSGARAKAPAKQAAQIVKKVKTPRDETNAPVINTTAE